MLYRVKGIKLTLHSAENPVMMLILSRIMLVEILKRILRTNKTSLL